MAIRSEKETPNTRAVGKGRYMAHRFLHAACDTRTDCLEASVEGYWGAEDVVDDVGVVVQALVHHETEDSHLGRAAVVELDATLLQLGLLVESIPAEVDKTVAEVTHKLSLASYIFHHEKLRRERIEDKMKN